MRRLKLIGSWKKLGVQAGLLGGLGLAFVSGTERPAEAGGQCPSEGMCSFKKPNFMIVLDYSSSMNTDFGNGQTRWEAAVEAIGTIFTSNNGFFNDNMHVALVRFGHDPSPGQAGSTINGDTSGLVDGVRLDDILAGQSFDVVTMDVEGSEYFALRGMPRLLAGARLLQIEFLPHHLRNVSGVSVRDFLNVIPAHFTTLTIPSKGITVTREHSLDALQQLYDEGRGDPGVVFAR